jgi:hypothetical protein
MQKPKENNDATASFNAYWPTHLINNAEKKRKERACMYKPKEKICGQKQLLQSIVV